MKDGFSNFKMSEAFKDLILVFEMLLYVFFVILEVFKGQKISEVNYIVHISSKKRTKYFTDSALPS